MLDVINICRVLLVILGAGSLFLVVKLLKPPKETLYTVSKLAWIAGVLNLLVDYAEQRLGFWHYAFHYRVLGFPLDLYIAVSLFIGGSMCLIYWWLTSSHRKWASALFFALPFYFLLQDYAVISLSGKSIIVLDSPFWWIADFVSVSIIAWGTLLIFKYFLNHKPKKFLWALLVLLPPLILALPPLPQYFISQLVMGEVPTKNFSLSTNFAPLGATLLSEALNIKTGNMPGYLNLNNDSVIYANNQVVKPPPYNFAPQEGLMTVPLFNNGTTTSLSIPIASSTRFYFAADEAGSAELGSEVQVQAVPLGIVASSTKISSTSVEVWYYPTSVIYKLSGYEGYDWSWSIYLHNLLLIFLGWVIVLASLMAVLSPLQRKY